MNYFCRLSFCAQEWVQKLPKTAEVASVLTFIAKVRRVIPRRAAQAWNRRDAGRTATDASRRLYLCPQERLMYIGCLFWRNLWKFSLISLRFSCTLLCMWIWSWQLEGEVYFLNYEVHHVTFHWNLHPAYRCVLQTNDLSNEKKF